MDELPALPASRLKIELIAAGVPVRSVRYDGSGLYVTYDATVTQGDIDIAEPIIAAARERLTNSK